MRIVSLYIAYLW